MSSTSSSSSSVSSDSGVTAYYTEKDRKYDRQTRLWGGHGQRALENSHVLVLGSSACSSEILKNLVLPSVGHFTILDDVKVTEGDLGNNFFVDESSLGLNRAEVVKDYLLQLNPDVKGDCILRNVNDFIGDDKQRHAVVPHYQLVIVAANSVSLCSSSFQSFASHLYSSNTPLLIVKVIGFISFVRFQIREHTIMETHPMEKFKDYSIHPSHWKHFPDLLSFLTQPQFSIDDKSLDPVARSRIPAPSILVQCAQKWQADHSGKLPETLSEKTAFKNFIMSFCVNRAEEENFSEAQEDAASVYMKKPLNQLAAQTYADEHASHLSSSSSSFWFLVRALYDFTCAHDGNPPVSSNIPDFHTDTKTYLEMKNLFKKKETEHLADIKERVKALLKAAGKEETSISEEEVQHFVVNGNQIGFISTKSFAEEYTEGKLDGAGLSNHLDEVWMGAETQLVPNGCWYIAIRAREAFYAKFNRWPGESDEKVEEDANALMEFAQNLMGENNVEGNGFQPESIEEIARYGDCEPHNIAAVMGGVVGQIAVQILMKQYVPVNHTFIYSGLDCSSSTLKV